jgi:outer membrane protein assembly factor BamB
MRLVKRCGGVVVALCAVVFNAAGENWPQWRGPRGDGTSLETNVPVKWSATENVMWKSAMPGEGHSSPIVWGNAVFVTTAVKETRKRLLLRLHAETGKVVWERTVVVAEPESMHRENSSASSTPVTDGQYIFTSFQAGARVDLRGFDFNGKQIWAVQPLQFEGQHGYSYSPVLFNELLIFDCRQEGEAAVLALDKRTGAVRWRAVPGNRRISHVTPLLVNHPRGTQLVVCGSNETCGYDPLTGKQLWRCQGPDDVAVAGLSFGEGLVFATAGYPTRTRMAVRVDGKGNVTGTHVKWKEHRQATYVPSPVYHAGHLYTMLDDGLLYCFDAQSGKPVWEYRLGGRFRSSLVLANEKIYATNDKGLTTVFAADPKGFRLLGSNDVKEFCYGTSAISNGRVYLRTGERLWCFAEEKQLTRN